MGHAVDAVEARGLGEGEEDVECFGLQRGALQCGFDDGLGDAEAEAGVEAARGLAGGELGQGGGDAGVVVDGAFGFGGEGWICEEGCNEWRVVA